jgi:hypothetical protein
MDVSNMMSPHFSFGEMTATVHENYIQENRLLARNFLVNGMALCNLLERVRAYLNVPIFISSAFRCADLNAAVGGAAHSQHCLFQAADTTYAGYTLVDAYNKIAHNDIGIEFGQLIYEFGSWIHISIPDPLNYPGVTMQLLKADSVAGETVYTPITGMLA